MRGVGWLAIVVSLRLTAVTFAQTQPATEPTTNPADQLIKQLSADDWHQRQDAQKRLIELGPAAVDALRATTQAAVDDETRSRVESALAEISDNQVSGTSLITLHLQDQPPSVIFAELAKQCNATLEPMMPELWQMRPVPPLTIDFDRKPFWEVMSDLTERTGIVLQPSENGMRLAIGMRVQHGPQTVSGAFRITADSVRRSQMINLMVGKTRSDDFDVMLSINAEPKIRLGQVWNEAQLNVAVDDRGNSLLNDVSPVRGGGGYFNGQMGMWSVQVPLHYPQNNPGTKIAHLAGTARAEVKTQIQSIDFGEVMTAQNVRKTLARHALTLISAEKQGMEYVVHLSGELSAATPEELNNNDWSPQNFAMIDANGHAMMLRGTSQTPGNNRQNLELRFGPARANIIRRGARATEEVAPAHLKWTLATSNKMVEIPFEFNDLPMP